MTKSDLQSTVTQERKLEELVLLNEKVRIGLVKLQKANNLYELKYSKTDQHLGINAMVKKNKQIDNNFKSNLLMLDYKISTAYYKKYEYYVNIL